MKVVNPFQVLSSRAFTSILKDDLQAEFETFRHRKIDRITEPVILLQTIFFVAFFGIDAVVLPDVVLLSAVLRCLIGLPLVIVAIALLRRPGHRSASHDAAGALVSIGIGVITCLVLSRSQAPLASMYLAVNNATIMCAILAVGMRPSHAALVALVSIAGQVFFELTTPSFSSDSLLLMTVISITVVLPSLYVNASLYRGLEHQFLAKHRDGEQMRKLRAQNDLLYRLSALDPLTSLSNRRSFDAVLRTTIMEARDSSHERSVALALVDIDHFKLFNDTLGHLAGDEALRSVGLALSEASGADSLVARYGGEEFAIILPNVCQTSLELLGKKLRIGVERLHLQHPSSPTGKTLSISVGIAAAGANVIDRLKPDDLIDAADRALYRAKNEGRNRVAMAAPLRIDRTPTRSPAKRAVEPVLPAPKLSMSDLSAA